jgi:ABC-type uncharacterized transport system ATPase component
MYKLQIWHVRSEILNRLFILVFLSGHGNSRLFFVVSGYIDCTAGKGKLNEFEIQGWYSSREESDLLQMLLFDRTFLQTVSPKES